MMRILDELEQLGISDVTPPLTFWQRLRVLERRLEDAKRKEIVVVLKAPQFTQEGRMEIFHKHRMERAEKRMLNAAKDSEPEEMLKAIENGVSPNFMLPSGETPLTLFVHMKAAKYFRRLIELGANSSVHNTDGWTPLMLAVLADDESMVTELMRLGADPGVACWVDPVLGEDACPLHMACAKGSVRCVAALLGNGADANVRNRKGRTPLMFATRFRQVQVVKALLAERVDYDARDRSGFSATDWLRCAVRESVLQRGMGMEGEFVTAEEKAWKKSGSLWAKSWIGHLSNLENIDVPTLEDMIQAQVGYLKMSALDTEIFLLIEEEIRKARVRVRQLAEKKDEGKQTRLAQALHVPSLRGAITPRKILSAATNTAATPLARIRSALEIEKQAIITRSFVRHALLSREVAQVEQEQMAVTTAGKPLPPYLTFQMPPLPDIHTSEANRLLNLVQEGHYKLPLRMTFYGRLRTWLPLLVASRRHLLTKIKIDENGYQIYDDSPSVSSPSLSNSNNTLSSPIGRAKSISFSLSNEDNQSPMASPTVHPRVQIALPSEMIPPKLRYQVPLDFSLPVEEDEGAYVIGIAPEEDDDDAASSASGSGSGSNADQNMSPGGKSLQRTFSKSSAPGIGRKYPTPIDLEFAFGPQYSHLQRLSGSRVIPDSADFPLWVFAEANADTTCLPLSIKEKQHSGADRLRRNQLRDPGSLAEYTKMADQGTLRHVQNWLRTLGRAQRNPFAGGLTSLAKAANETARIDPSAIPFRGLDKSGPPLLLENDQSMVDRGMPPITGVPMVHRERTTISHIVETAIVQLADMIKLSGDFDFHAPEAELEKLVLDPVKHLGLQYSIHAAMRNALVFYHKQKLEAIGELAAPVVNSEVSSIENVDVAGYEPSSDPCAHCEQRRACVKCLNCAQIQCERCCLWLHKQPGYRHHRVKALLPPGLTEGRLMTRQARRLAAIRLDRERLTNFPRYIDRLRKLVRKAQQTVLDRRMRRDKKEAMATALHTALTVASSTTTTAGASNDPHAVHATHHDGILLHPNQPISEKNPLLLPAPTSPGTGLALLKNSRFGVYSQWIHNVPGAKEHPDALDPVPEPDTLEPEDAGYVPPPAVLGKLMGIYPALSKWMGVPLHPLFVPPPPGLPPPPRFPHLPPGHTPAPVPGFDYRNEFEPFKYFHVPSKLATALDVKELAYLRPLPTELPVARAPGRSVLEESAARLNVSPTDIKNVAILASGVRHVSERLLKEVDEAKIVDELEESRNLGFLSAEAMAAMKEVEYNTAKKDQIEKELQMQRDRDRKRRELFNLPLSDPIEGGGESSPDPGHDGMRSSTPSSTPSTAQGTRAASPTAQRATSAALAPDEPLLPAACCATLDTRCGEQDDCRCAEGHNCVMALLLPMEDVPAVMLQNQRFFDQCRLYWRPPTVLPGVVDALQNAVTVTENNAESNALVSGDDANTDGNSTVLTVHEANGTVTPKVYTPKSLSDLFLHITRMDLDETPAATVVGIMALEEHHLRESVEAAWQYEPFQHLNQSNWTYFSIIRWLEQHDALYNTDQFLPSVEKMGIAPDLEDIQRKFWTQFDFSPSPLLLYALDKYRNYKPETKDKHAEFARAEAKRRSVASIAAALNRGELLSFNAPGSMPHTPTHTEHAKAAQQANKVRQTLETLAGTYGNAMSIPKTLQEAVVARAPIPLTAASRNDLQSVRASVRDRPTKDLTNSSDRDASVLALTDLEASIGGGGFPALLPRRLDLQSMDDSGNDNAGESSSNALVPFASANSYSELVPYEAPTPDALSAITEALGHDPEPFSLAPVVPVTRILRYIGSEEVLEKLGMFKRNAIVAVQFPITSTQSMPGKHSSINFMDLPGIKAALHYSHNKLWHQSESLYLDAIKKQKELIVPSVPQPLIHVLLEYASMFFARLGVSHLLLKQDSIAQSHAEHAVRDTVYTAPLQPLPLLPDVHRIAYLLHLCEGYMKQIQPPIKSSDNLCHRLHRYQGLLLEILGKYTDAQLHYARVLHLLRVEGESAVDALSSHKYPFCVLPHSVRQAAVIADAMAALLLPRYERLVGYSERAVMLCEDRIEVVRLQREKRDAEWTKRQERITELRRTRNVGLSLPSSEIRSSSPLKLPAPPLASSTASVASAFSPTAASSPQPSISPLPQLTEVSTSPTPAVDSTNTDRTESSSGAMVSPRPSTSSSSSLVPHTPSTSKPSTPFTPGGTILRRTATPKTRAEEVQQALLDATLDELQAILENPRWARQLYQAACDWGLDREVQFLLAATAYKSIASVGKTSARKLEKRAGSWIFTRFVAGSSALKTVTAASRTRVESLIAAGGPTCFDDAVRDVSEHLAVSLVPRFLGSHRGRIYIQERCLMLYLPSWNVAQVCRLLEPDRLAMIIWCQAIVRGWLTRLRLKRQKLQGMETVPLTDMTPPGSAGTVPGPEGSSSGSPWRSSPSRSSGGSDGLDASPGSYFNMHSDLSPNGKFATETNRNTLRSRERSRPDLNALYDSEEHSPLKDRDLCVSLNDHDEYSDSDEIATPPPRALPEQEVPPLNLDGKEGNHEEGELRDELLSTLGPLSFGEKLEPLDMEVAYGSDTTGVPDSILESLAAARKHADREVRQSWTQEQKEEWAIGVLQRVCKGHIVRKQVALSADPYWLPVKDEKSGYYYYTFLPTGETRWKLPPYLPYNRITLKVMCCACYKNMATKYCSPCFESFCDTCYTLGHAELQNKDKHHWCQIPEYRTTEQSNGACLNCEVRLGVLSCGDCGEVRYCSQCFRLLHSSGARSKHKPTLLYMPTHTASGKPVLENRNPI